MRCAICKKEGDEVELFEGIHNAEIIMTCAYCSDNEGIPIVKRPSQEQIEQSKKTYSVRERMEIMSGMRKTTSISDEQSIIQGNLAKLKMPEAKQTHPDIFDNYYWQVNMGRRRKKITLNQMASQTGISSEVIESIEKGKIPQDHKNVFLKLELFLGIKLLKIRPQKMTLTQMINEEKEILARVKQKMDSKSVDWEEGHRREKVERIIDDNFDFSDRKHLQEVTLNDLIDMKRRKEKKEKEHLEKSKKDSMIGDEIDLELE